MTVALLLSGCTRSAEIEPGSDFYTYEPAEVTGSTIMVDHPSYEPSDLPESLSASE